MDTSDQIPDGLGAGMTERRRVARALRALACEVVGADLVDGEFAPIAAMLESMRDRLAAAPRLVRDTAGLHSPEVAGKRAGLEPVYDRDPIAGLSNPLAPPLRRVACDQGTHFEVTFADAYEGHPGFVHGGYVAAVLDHVLGVTSLAAGFAAMTGTLTTRFRNPTPTRALLTCTGEVQRVDGRKVFCRAVLRADDVTVADAEGVYFLLPPNRFGSD